MGSLFKHGPKIVPYAGYGIGKWTLARSYVASFSLSTKTSVGLHDPIWRRFRAETAPHPPAGPGIRPGHSGDPAGSLRGSVRAAGIATFALYIRDMVKAGGLCASIVV